MVPLKIGRAWVFVLFLLCLSQSEAVFPRTTRLTECRRLPLSALTTAFFLPNFCLHFRDKPPLPKKGPAGCLCNASGRAAPEAGGGSASMKSHFHRQTHLSAASSEGAVREVSGEEEEELRRLQERSAREVEEVRRIRALRYYQQRMQREARCSQQQKRKLADGEFASSKTKEVKVEGPSWGGAPPLRPSSSREETEELGSKSDGSRRTSPPERRAGEEELSVDRLQSLTAATQSLVHNRPLLGHPLGFSRGGTAGADAGETLEILTWNINGLEESFLSLRTEAVASTILEISPAAVLLQEVTEESARVLLRRLKDKFHFFFPSKPGEEAAASTRRAAAGECREAERLVKDCPYFCAVLINKDKLVPPKRNSLQTLWFPGSRMYRHLMYGVCCPKTAPRNGGEENASAEDATAEAPLLLLTSHLESTWTFREERVEQLKCCFKLMHAVTSSDPAAEASAAGLPPSLASAFPFGRPQKVRSAVLAGDLNLRDRELLAPSGQGSATVVPKDTLDAFEYLGRPRECMYTWDRTKAGDSRSKTRCRFDRVYVTTRPSLLQSEVGAGGGGGFAGSGMVAVWEPTKMRLVGTQRLRSIDEFPSDHFGVLCSLKKVFRRE